MTVANVPGTFLPPERRVWRFPADARDWKTTVYVPAVAWQFKIYEDDKGKYIVHERSTLPVMHRPYNPFRELEGR